MTAMTTLSLQFYRDLASLITLHNPPFHNRTSALK